MTREFDMALDRLVEVTREAVQRQHNMGSCIESSATLGAGETLYSEISYLLCGPEHHVPKSVQEAFYDTQRLRAM